MRHLLIVTYDIANPKRLRRVFRTLKGFGDHLQLSVFRCDIDALRRIHLEATLSEIIHHGEDQVIFIDLGPADGRAHRVTSIGQALPPGRGDASVF